VQYGSGDLFNPKLVHRHPPQSAWPRTSASPGPPFQSNHRLAIEFPFKCDSQLEPPIVDSNYNNFVQKWKTRASYAYEVAISHAPDSSNFSGETR